MSTCVESAVMLLCWPLRPPLTGTVAVSPYACALLLGISDRRQMMPIETLVAKTKQCTAMCGSKPRLGFACLFNHSLAENFASHPIVCQPNHWIGHSPLR